jgi:hypothetical protein
MNTDTTKRYKVAPYDHGFEMAGARYFDTIEEADTFRGEQKGGREVSAMGRVQRDITWHTKDQETGEYVAAPVVGEVF